MNLRLLLILAAVVAGLGGAAYYFGQERKALQSEAFVGGPLIAGIETRINDVDHMRLESQEGGVLNLDRTADGWTIQEQHGYRANPERVTELLKRVATLTTVEPKTSKPENHARLNLDDPAGENALGTRITLKDGDATVADLVVGLNRPEPQGGGAFVRLWGDDQTWLTEQDFKPKRRTLDLIDRNVVNVDGRRIRLARIQHPPAEAGGEGDRFMISKDTPDQETYSLGATIPEGMQAKEDHELSPVARLSDFLILEAVRPASEVQMDKPVVGVFETFDGLRLIYRAQEQADGKIWVEVSAEAAPRSPELDDFIAANKGQDSEVGRIADQFKTPEAVADEIAMWSRKTAGWAYKLTDYKTDRLTSTTADLIEAPKEETAQPNPQPSQ